ncbi:hypothetical protein HAV22_28805 [Massilia sp. TW-1]|uniref:Transposase n=1 Tax=Telluria antibiotica TaxID=2717319 RepID=A0ABX0PLF8_9BURK|nr:hypothetical protein [Telluria antibiotica]NIA57632.1 hypothetical protein [Telluria antibiotica]
MREDMFKVIVERPRLVNSNGYSRDGRKFRNDENAPGRLGMKRGYTQRPKWLNENLAPLKRYLEQQVDRPWDKVYSEIRATIDARSTVKQHILQHIGDFVATDTHWVETPSGGRVVVRNQNWWNRKEVALEEADVELFVHPKTGILLRNRRFVSWDRRNRQMRETKQAQDHLDCRDIDVHRQLRRIDGIWYEVTLGLLPAPRVQGKDIVCGAFWDVVRKEWVQRQHGVAETYAVSKRQLGAKELKKYALGA